MNPRPTSVTVMSIIGLVLSGLTILALCWGAVSPFVKLGPPNAAVEAMESQPMYLAIKIGGSILSLVVVGLLTAGSIGSLKMKT